MTRNGKDRPLATAEQEAELVRYEERATFATVEREAGRIHLRKTAETEVERREMDLRVEHAAIERVPAAEHDSGVIETLPDGSVSIPIVEEEVVVTKRLVVRERVIIRKQVEMQRRSIELPLRRERIDIAVDPEIRDRVHGQLRESPFH
jgi:uncharacterized protein (TIGR02271 family)